VGEPRAPGRVPDDHSHLDPGGGLGVGSGFDTDGDGTPDTTVGSDGVDLVVAVDLDGDLFADQVLRIGPDAVVRLAGPPQPPGPCDVEGGADGGGDQ
jgi:hypothetical protein